jgi:ABC-type bacteriocin/lantibiotic exporter with double-glycine peptidase domain
LASFPYIAQYQQDDCGVTALQMVCLYHGKWVSSDEVRKACKVQFGELSFLGLSRGAKALGLEVLPLKLSTEELSSTIATPFIALIENQHYIVVYRFNASWVWIADPAIGRYKIPRKDFEASWLHQGKGFALVLKPNETWQPSPSGATGKEEHSLSIWKPSASIMDFLVIILEVFTLFFILQLLGYLLEHTPTSGLTAHAYASYLAFVFLAAAWMFTNGWWHQTFRHRAQKASRSLRRYVHAEPESFNEVEMAHDLLDQARIEERLSARLGMHRNFTLALFFVMWLTYQFPQLGLVSLLIMVMLLLIVRTDSLRFTGAYYWSFLSRDKQLIFNLFPRVFKRNSGGLPQADQDQKRLHQAMLYPYTMILLSGVLWVLLLLLFWQINSMTFPLLFALSVAGVGFLYTLGGSLAAIRAWYLRNLDQLANLPSVDEPLPELDLKNSTISYQSAEDDQYQEVIISPGKSTLILGQAKSGKSLLLQRLMGRNIEDGGMWMLDGKPISIGQRAVIQSNILFIGHMVQSVTSHEFQDFQMPSGAGWEALCDRFGLSVVKNEPDTIERLPDKVLEQQQKLIAIAVYRDPEILILDEPLKGMNPFHALIFMENLLAIRKGKTTVLSSQSEEMIPLCDEVFTIQSKVG